MGVKAQPLNLKHDESFIGARWFKNEKTVFNVFRRMIHCGWEATPGEGITSIRQNGDSVVAKPLKINGDSHFSGIGVFKLYNCGANH